MSVETVQLHVYINN